MSSDTIDPKKLEKERKRNEVVKEIYKTEATYIEGLKFLEKFYVLPLMVLNKHKATIVIESQDYKKCFEPIQMIARLNEQLQKRLLDLEKGTADEKWNSIGKIFKSMGCLFKSYTSYVNEYDDIAMRIKTLIKENVRFQQFMREIEMKTKSDGNNTFFAYMITPVQRIPRYILLLRELLRQTETTDGDYNMIMLAIAEIEAVAMHLNESKKEYENTKKTTFIKANISGLEVLEEDLVKRNRNFVLESEMAIKKSKHTLFLFSDILLLCRKKKLIHLVRLTDIPLVSASPEPEEGEASDTAIQFRIQTVKHTFIITANNKDECAKWVRAINESVETLCKANINMQGQPKAVPPTKVKKRFTLPSLSFGASPIHVERTPSMSASDPNLSATATAELHDSEETVSVNPLFQVTTPKGLVTTVETARTVTEDNQYSPSPSVQDSEPLPTNTKSSEFDDDETLTTDPTADLQSEAGEPEEQQHEELQNDELAQADNSQEHIPETAPTVEEAEPLESTSEETHHHDQLNEQEHVESAEHAEHTQGSTEHAEVSQQITAHAEQTNEHSLENPKPEDPAQNQHTEKPKGQQTPQPEPEPVPQTSPESKRIEPKHDASGGVKKKWPTVQPVHPIQRASVRMPHALELGVPVLPTVKKSPRLSETSPAPTEEKSPSVRKLSMPQAIPTSKEVDLQEVLKNSLKRRESVDFRQALAKKQAEQTNQTNVAPWMQEIGKKFQGRKLSALVSTETKGEEQQSGAQSSTTHQ